jgi:hypothetical protein
MQKTLLTILAAALLLSCKPKQVNVQQTAVTDTTTVLKEQKTVQPSSAATFTDTLNKALGNYYSNCTPDTSKQIKLVLAKANNQYTAQLYDEIKKIQITGVLHKDTVNFDADFNIWSFNKGKAIYGFRYSKNDNNGIDVALINEDYKPEFKACTDAKEIDFTKH